MRTPERFTLYTLLAASLATSALCLLIVSSPVAMAQQDPAAAPALPSLTLSGPGGDLILKNSGRRLAWGEDDHSKAYSTAFVHIGKVLKQLAASETYQEEIEALRKELEEQEADYRSKLEEISGRIEGLDQNSEEFKRIYEEGEKIFTEYREWAGKVAARRNEMEAKHLETSYRQLVEAVEVISERKNIDLVYRFIATEEPFEAKSAEEALNEIRLRTVLKYPQGLDITPDVLKELSLSDE